MVSKGSQQITRSCSLTARPVALVCRESLSHYLTPYFVLLSTSLKNGSFFLAVSLSISGSLPSGIPPDEPVRKCELQVAVEAEACLCEQYKTNVNNSNLSLRAEEQQQQQTTVA